MSLEVSLQIDTGHFNRSLNQFAGLSKKTGLQVLLDASKGFVRQAIGLTPPATGKADSKAKVRGEQAVSSDLRQIFDPLDPYEWKAFYDDAGGLQIVPTFRPNRRGAAVTDLTLFLKRGEMEPFHDRMRSKSTGHVRRVNRENLIGRKKSDISEIAFVTKQDFAWFERQTKKRVGMLSSGWNASAEKLGYRPPAWIRRHGTSRGQVSIVIGRERFQVSVANDVKFVNHVKGMERQIQTALDWQARNMDRRIEYYYEHNGRAAGFK
ncbi:MAG: hypothetical protein P4L99_28120 [Chthoniobacter sp.]|nr:hypothetical protein [Chthoniobacter sp.]